MRPSGLPKCNLTTVRAVARSPRNALSAVHAAYCRNTRSTSELAGVFGREQGNSPMTKFRFLAAVAAAGALAVPAAAQYYPQQYQPQQQYQYPQQGYPQQAYPQQGYGY